MNQLALEMINILPLINLIQLEKGPIVNIVTNKKYTLVCMCMNAHKHTHIYTHMNRYMVMVYCMIDTTMGLWWYDVWLIPLWGLWWYDVWLILLWGCDGILYDWYYCGVVMVYCMIDTTVGWWWYDVWLILLWGLWWYCIVNIKYYSWKWRYKY